MNDDEDQQVSAVWTKPIKGLKERLNDIYAPPGSLVRDVIDEHGVTKERAEYLIEAFGG
jgi:hypothetical protein